MRRGVDVVDVFRVGKRTCVVIKMTSILARGYHNGYVSCRKRTGQIDYDEDKVRDAINADEPTFSGTLNHLEDDRIPRDVWFIGFDSAHYWNCERPESQTHESVKTRTIEMAKEMIEAGI